MTSAICNLVSAAWLAARLASAVTSVRSAGIELAGNDRFGGGFGSFASYSDSDATDRNEVCDGTRALVAAIKGKTLTDAPKHLRTIYVSYDRSSDFGRIGVHHQRKAEIQLNASNLFDKSHISTTSTNAFGNLGDNQTWLNGAPHPIFATLKVGL